MLFLPSRSTGFFGQGVGLDTCRSRYGVRDAWQVLK